MTSSRATHSRPLNLHVIVVMGVSGAGKTTVGQALAAATGWSFRDGDDFHSAANIEKMHRGEGLTDADRESWLAALAALIERIVHDGKHEILACSALKHAYRERLRAAAAKAGRGDALELVYLDVPADVLRQRLAGRSHPFATPALLDSQLATLEPPSDALRVDGTLPVGEIVDAIRRAFDI
jgi:gluconokinase